MSNEMVYGVVGLLTGSVIGSTSKDIECMSVPLYDRQIVDQTPLMSDYLDLTVFPNSKTGIDSHDYWHGGVFKDSAGNYIQIANFHMYNKFHKVWYKNYTTGEYLAQQVSNPSHITFEYIGDLIRITSPLGVVIINTITNFSTVDMTLSGHNLSLTYTGKPIFYNDKNVLTIVPNNYYLKGFELVGNSSGTFDGFPIYGFGDFERVNWNWTAEMIPGEKWIGFTIGNGETCGVIYAQGLVKDAGIYINGIYKKPILFNVNTVTYQYTNQKIYPLDQEVHVQLKEGIFILVMKWKGKQKNENIYDVSAYLNGTPLGTGLSWVEMSGVI